MNRKIECVSFSCDRLRDQYGVIPLTGEACKFSLRILCDLSPAGMELVESFYGNTVSVVTGSNWNSSYDAKGSIMLTRHAMHELFFFGLLIDEKYSGEYILYDEKLDHFIIASSSEIEKWNETIDKSFMFPNGFIRAKRSIQSRNTHQFTGRTY